MAIEIPDTLDELMKWADTPSNLIDIDQEKLDEIRKGISNVGSAKKENDKSQDANPDHNKPNPSQTGSSNVQPPQPAISTGPGIIKLREYLIKKYDVKTKQLSLIFRLLKLAEMRGENGKEMVAYFGFDDKNLKKLLEAILIKINPELVELNRPEEDRTQLKEAIKAAESIEDFLFSHIFGFSNQHPQDLIEDKLDKLMREFNCPKYLDYDMERKIDVLSALKNIDKKAKNEKRALRFGEMTEIASINRIFHRSSTITTFDEKWIQERLSQAQPQNTPRVPMASAAPAPQPAAPVAPAPAPTPAPQPVAAPVAPAPAPQPVAIVTPAPMPTPAPQPASSIAPTPAPQHVMGIVTPTEVTPAPQPVTPVAPPTPAPQPVVNVTPAPTPTPVVTPIESTAVTKIVAIPVAPQPAPANNESTKIESPDYLEALKRMSDLFEIFKNGDIKTLAPFASKINKMESSKGITLGTSFLGLKKRPETPEELIQRVFGTQAEEEMADKIIEIDQEFTEKDLYNQIPQ